MSGSVVNYAYDALGWLQTVTDRNGQPTRDAYDGSSAHLTTITDSNTHVQVTNHYDSNGRVDWQKDALGLSTGQQTSIAPYGAAATCPVGATAPCTATTAAFPSNSFDGKAMTVVDMYDANGRLVRRVSNPSNDATEAPTETFAYNTYGFRSGVVDGQGNSTTVCYDTDYTGTSVPGSRGNLTRTIAPAPSGGNPLVTLLKYDSVNNLVESIAPRGVSNAATVTCSTNLSANLNLLYAADYAYDSAGVQLLSTTRTYTDPDLGQQTQITKFEFGDSANPGQVTRSIPPRGNTASGPDYTYATTFVYNDTGSQAGLVQSTTDPLGNKTSYIYDALGRKISMVDANGQAGDHTWSFVYDNEDRVTSASAPAPTGSGAKLTTYQHYDAAGNRDSVQDANGQFTRFVFDVRNTLQEVDESTTAFDPNNDPSKIVTKYTYDNLGNLQRVLRAAGDSANERATDYAYDGVNRVRKEIQYPSWPSMSSILVTQYGYDKNSNRTSVVDPLSQTTTFGYDALNRVTGVVYSNTATATTATVNLSYNYDANGNRLSMTDGTGQTTYAYDELDRPTRITSPGSLIVGYRYDLDGNPAKLLYPDTTVVTSIFNKGSQLASLADWANRNTGYTYFPDGHLNQVSNVNGTTGTFTYDNAHRLKQILNQQGLTTLNQHTYTLDSVGNRTQVAEVLAQVGGGSISPTTNYSYDKLYRLSTDGTNTYTYDPVGNRLTADGTTSSYDRADHTTGSGVNADGNLAQRGPDALGYDQANRLTCYHAASSSQCVPNTATSTYAYDGECKRTSSTSASATTTYTYDIRGGAPALLTDGVRKYIWGANGLAYETDSSGAIQAVPLVDGLGSVRALTDSSGALIKTFRTDAFGVQTQGSNTQPFGFTGEQSDPTGLTYLQGRMYDPATGRFMQRDAPDGGNRYAYAANNPATRIDPSGADSFDPGFGSDDSRPRCGDQLKDPFHLLCPRGVLVTTTGQVLTFDPDIQSLLGALAAANGGDSESVGTGGSGPSFDASSGATGGGSLIERARAARDAFARRVGRAVATVIGGYNVETGDVAVGINGGGMHAEDAVVVKLGGDPSKVRFTEAVRPRFLATPDEQVPICLRCQGRYGRSQFPPNVEFDLGGAWSKP